MAFVLAVFPRVIVQSKAWGDRTTLWGTGSLTRSSGALLYLVVSSTSEQITRITCDAYTSLSHQCKRGICPDAEEQHVRH